MRQLTHTLARQWVRLGPRFLPFADVATADLPLARLLRLGLFQVSVGMAAVLLTGTLNRVTVVDSRRAWVVEQHIYDPTGTTLLASAVAESFRYYPAQQVSLPERVAIRLPTANMSLKIDLGTMQINQLAGNRQQLWSMPAFEGYAQYDLSGAVPGTPLPGQPSAHSYTPAIGPASPAASYLPAGGILPASRPTY